MYSNKIEKINFIYLRNKARHNNNKNNNRNKMKCPTLPTSKIDLSEEF